MPTITKLVCPSCGANLEAEDNLETFFCKYCGQKIILSNQSKTALAAKFLTNTMDRLERISNKREEEARKERERAQKHVLLGILGFFLLALLFIIGGIIAGKIGL